MSPEVDFKRHVLSGLGCGHSTVLGKATAPAPAKVYGVGTRRVSSSNQDRKTFPLILHYLVVSYCLSSHLRELKRPRASDALRSAS